MNRRIIVAALTTVLLAALPLSADPGRLAIAGRAGTLGLGGDVMINILPDLNLRLGVGALDLDYDDEFSDVDYDFELDLLTFPVTLDWYPFDDKFYVSAGVVFNETDVTLDASYSGTVDIGGTTYTAAEVGVLSGGLGFENVAPYIGIGWGNAFGRSRRWGFLADLGVAFTGSPDVALSATGTLAADPTFRANLERERADIEEDLEDFKIYPVLSMNLYFRF